MRMLPGILLALLGLTSGAFAGPQRVVSMNLCTDQLAMLLAAPDQLISVSYIARDPRASAMVEEAHNFPINHGLAEEIYLLKPDLVIAGAFSTRTTTDMLKRLGVPVVVFQPAYSLDDVRARILQMGEVLDQSAAAAALAAEFQHTLDALKAEGAERPRAATYSASGYTSGVQSLAGEIIDAAGLRNIAAEYGFQNSGRMPLEVLAMSDPDMLIGTVPYPRASRSEEILAHPVVTHLADQTSATEMRDADWVCGTPHVLRAISTLMADRNTLLAETNK